MHHQFNFLCYNVLLVSCLKEYRATIGFCLFSLHPFGLLDLETCVRLCCWLSGVCEVTLQCGGAVLLSRWYCVLKASVQVNLMSWQDVASEVAYYMCACVSK